MLWSPWVLAISLLSGLNTTRKHDRVGPRSWHCFTENSLSISLFSANSSIAWFTPVLQCLLPNLTIIVHFLLLVELKHIKEAWHYCTNLWSWICYRYLWDRDHTWCVLVVWMRELVAEDLLHTLAALAPHHWSSDPPWYCVKCLLKHSSSLD